MEKHCEKHGSSSNSVCGKFLGLMLTVELGHYYMRESLPKNVVLQSCHNSTEMHRIWRKSF